jgi:hypothetical protein
LSRHGLRHEVAGGAGTIISHFAFPIPHYTLTVMFHLTRRERLLIAGLLLAFLTGLAVKHYRGIGGGDAATETQHTDAKR